MPYALIRDEAATALTHAMERAKQEQGWDIVSMPSASLELPKREEWGDMSSTVAMALARGVRRPPLEVASALAAALEHESSELFERVEVAPPGFLNLTIRRQHWIEVLKHIETAGHAYGEGQLGQGQRVLLEFVSANPTGPLHVGHGRGAALGQALARLLAAVGYRVEREYYINDAGRQLKLLGQSVLARYREQYGLATTFPEDGYHGEYIRDLAEQLAKEVGTALLELSPEEAEHRCVEFAYQRLLEQIKEDLRAFGVEFDHWFSERQLLESGQLQRTLEELRQKGLLFEKDGAWWFASSRFSDDKDRVVAKQDGEYTYLASDIAYHRQKLERGFDLLINIWGADHHGYIPRLHAAIQAFGYPKERLRIVLVQMVTLLRAGKKLEMSKRAGEFVTLRDVVNEVGPDAAKFFFLMRRSDTHLDFDLDLAKRQSAENPVYYVQYAHARLASLFRVAAARGVPVPTVDRVVPALLVGTDELRIIKQLATYPVLVEQSAAALEPHRITFYLQNLAGLLHTYYYRHRVLPSVREEFDPDRDRSRALAASHSDESEEEREAVTPETTAARLALLRQVQTVIRNGLTVLGVSAPEQM
ncbi:MAG: arginine--tRNA ligase [Nitrospirae bacterium]|nr:MAG: arginine--tRNA ligase [Nitrospirota bacterium]